MQFLYDVILGNPRMQYHIEMFRKYPEIMALCTIGVSVLFTFVIHMKKGVSWNEERGYIARWKQGTFMSRVIISLGDGVFCGCACVLIWQHLAKTHGVFFTPTSLVLVGAIGIWTTYTGRNKLAWAENAK